jgi:hypothetical protein
VLGLSASQAFLYMRVAQTFGAEMVALYGAERLDRGLRYILATAEDESPADLPTLAIPVPDEQTGVVRAIRFPELTLADLRRALQRLRGAPARRAGAKAPAGTDPRVVAKLAAANKALDRAVGRKAARDADVLIKHTDAGVVVEIRGVPLERAATSLRTLAAALK